MKFVWNNMYVQRVHGSYFVVFVPVPIETPMVPAHVSIHLIIGRGIGTETCGMGSVIPPDDIGFVLITTSRLSHNQ